MTVNSHQENKKNQTRSQRKIPLILLLFHLPSGLVSKTGSREMEEIAKSQPILDDKVPLMRL